MSDLASLAEQVRLAGVVGAGGAGFPTHVKLAKPPKILIINGAECEPLLRVDQELLAKRADTILAAMIALKAALAPQDFYLAIKAKHAALISAWQQREHAGFRVHPLGDYYPAGDEHVLVHAVTGRTVPAGGIPADVGVTVMNVETLYNVGRAVQGLAVTQKFVTIGGAVARPCTVEVPVGTPFSSLLAMAGGVAGNPDQIAMIEGGPMMGRLVSDPHPVVTRTTKGILVLPDDMDVIRRRQVDWETVQRRSSSNCEICQRCTDLCPRNLLGHLLLEPHKVMRTYAYGGGPPPAPTMTGAAYCVECGVCELYACPVGIFPRRVTGGLKARLAAQGIRPTVDREHPPTPRPMQEERRVPSKRLVMRLGLGRYDVPAPLVDDPVPPNAGAAVTVYVPLKPPFGAPCQPVVTKGDQVEVGTVVGETPEKALGARAHASIAGWVEAVTDRHVVITGPAPPAGRK